MTRDLGTAILMLDGAPVSTASTEREAREIARSLGRDGVFTLWARGRSGDYAVVSAFDLFTLRQQARKEGKV